MPHIRSAASESSSEYSTTQTKHSKVTPEWNVVLLSSPNKLVSRGKCEQWNKGKKIKIISKFKENCKSVYIWKKIIRAFQYLATHTILKIYMTLFIWVVKM